MGRKAIEIMGGAVIAALSALGRARPAGKAKSYDWRT